MSHLLPAASYDWQTEGQPISDYFDTTSISGHPQNFEIVQDDKGYIYVANGAGILVYDGKQWQHW